MYIWLSILAATAPTNLICENFVFINCSYCRVIINIKKTADNHSPYH